MTTETAYPQYDVDSPENLARRERGLEVARSVDGEAARWPTSARRSATTSRLSASGTFTPARALSRAAGSW